MPVLTKPPQRKSQHSFLRRHKVFTAIIILAIAGLAGFQWSHVSQKRALEAEKARFAQAEREIDELTEQIIAAAGQPLRVDKSKYCSRPSAKLEEVPLGCDVAATIFYGVDSEDKANALLLTFRSTLKTKWASLTTKQLDTNNSFEGFELDQLEQYQRIMFKKADETLSCHLNNILYDSGHPPFADYVKTDTARYTIASELSCSGDAKLQHYPLRT